MPILKRIQKTSLKSFNWAILLKRDAFTKEALAKQYNPELLIKAGLTNNRNEQLNDNYRGRVIFPVHNHSGKVQGFGARILKTTDKAPKYINTPENEKFISRAKFCMVLILQGRQLTKQMNVYWWKAIPTYSPCTRRVLKMWLPVVAHLLL